MDNVCRTCLKVSSELRSIFEDSMLPHKIKIISDVEVCVDDMLPTGICEQCVRNIHLLYDFRCVLIRSNTKLIEKYTKPLKCEVLLSETDGTFSHKNGNDVDGTATNSHCEDDDSEDNKDELRKQYVTDALTKAKERKLQNYQCKTVSTNSTENESKQKFRKSICSICGAAVRHINLKKHILIHTEAPVNCKVCGKTCKNSESLRGHMFMHKGVILRCHICDKVYKHRAALTAHKKRHALGNVKTVPCKICGKCFYDKQVLQKHIRSHTGERPYPCPYCNKGFSSIYARTTHVRQHTNERPYACQFCNDAFPQKVSLKTHLKSKHPQEVEALQAL